MNQYWYVARAAKIRLEYRLTTDEAQEEPIDAVLDGCTPTTMTVLALTTTETSTATVTPNPTPSPAMHSDYGNGRISYAEARDHSVNQTPVDNGLSLMLRWPR